MDNGHTYVFKLHYRETSQIPLKLIFLRITISKTIVVGQLLYAKKMTL